MSTFTKILVSVDWDALEEIDRRADAAGMSRSKFLVTAALMPHSTNAVQLAAAADALRDGLAQYDAAMAREEPQR